MQETQIINYNLYIINYIYISTHIRSGEWNFAVKTLRIIKSGEKLENDYFVFLTIAKGVF